MEIKNENKKVKNHHPLITFVIVFLVTAFLMVTIHGWFYYMRKAMAIAEISNPTSLYINAANKEDIRYIDMSGLDLKDSTGQKDYVFCVRGKGITNYMLQLAYTTNNQLTFELYRANTGNPTVDAKGVVYYTTHTSSPTTITYYIPNDGQKISGYYLNSPIGTNEGKLAYTERSDPFYRLTYGENETDTSPYNYVHDNAVPVYWQTLSSMNVLDEDKDYLTGEFCHNYIIRVKWDVQTNNKETDILYIAAKNTTS